MMKGITFLDSPAVNLCPHFPPPGTPSSNREIGSLSSPRSSRHPGRSGSSYRPGVSCSLPKYQQQRWRDSQSGENKHRYESEIMWVLTTRASSVVSRWPIPARIPLLASRSSSQDRSIGTYSSTTRSTTYLYCSVFERLKTATTDAKFSSNSALQDLLCPILGYKYTARTGRLPHP